MKRHFLLLSIILAFNILNAQEVYRFRTDAPQGLNIERSTATALTLHYSLAEIGIATIDNDEAKGQEIILKGSFGSFAEGMPNLPTINRFIAVPRGATVSVEVMEKASQTLQDITLLPVAPLQMNGEAKRSPLHWDENVFGKDANFPEDNVVIAQTTQIRGLDVALLSVTPFRYNPVKKTLEVVYDMDIEVRFEGGNGQFGEARYRNPDWDGILRDLVVNSDMLPEAHYYDLLNEAIRNGEEGYEYLIISPDDEEILALADTLRQFRTKQGIRTKVVSVTECGGNDANAIKGYIQNAYDNWSIPPAAVMIFSAMDTLEVGTDFYWASSGIPGFGLLFRGYDNGYNIWDYHYSSDNPYADMNADSIPDLALSRLPALTLDEYRTQVHKLIQYETNPPTQSSFYDKPIVTSSYEDNKWFLITSQCVSQFYRKKLGRHPYNFYMLYDYYEYGYELPDTAWSTGYNTNVVVDYFGPNGQNYIAQRPDTLNQWRDIRDYSYLVDALNGNAFLTLYRDHSSYDLWCSPWVESSMVRTLTNTEPTFIFSIGCDAALSANLYYFEFADSYWSMGENPMIYEFCKAKVGALGGIGAATVTHSHYNDILTWGMIDNIWPNFMPDMGTMTQPEFTRPSYTLVAGKLFLNGHFFLPNWWPSHVLATNNVFHYLGETYLNLYTDVPQPIAMNVNPFHANDQWQYSFTAEAGATVCFSKGNEILQVLHGTGHSQSIMLPQMAIGEQFTITATMQNRFRYEQTVTIIPADQAFVYLKYATLVDQDGNGQLDYGEYSEFNLRLGNAGRYASAGGQITLLCDSPYVTLLQDNASYPRMEAGSSVTLCDVFRFKVADDVPDQTVLQFGLHFNDGENTHTDHFEFVANAPVIQIEPEFRPLTVDGEPSTHISTEGPSAISFSFKNTGHSTANHINAELSIKAPFVSVETPRTLFERLAPEDMLTATYELNTTPNDITGAWLQARLDLQFGECHAYMDTIVQYGGVFEGFETDTLNPLCLWNVGSSHPWTYSDEDAYEGQRCLISSASTASSSTLTARMKNSPEHRCKISFRYKTGGDEGLQFTLGSTTDQLSSEGWSYVESPYSGNTTNFKWKYTQTDEHGMQAKLDDFWFPPVHTVIAYAGNDMLSCGESPVTLAEAYAYDCESVLWTTEGDGHFESDTIVNATYIPGSQDIANEQVALTLQAFGDNPVASTTTVRFVDEITLGSIVGDSLVNKYESQVSRYAVENQDGVNYVWTLEPAEAGAIYNHGNAIDLVWNLHEGDMEVVLSVTADNGCDVEPVSKRISLIGTGVTEWNAFDFDLYPNPTDGKVNLVIGESLQGKAVIEVYNLLGERMLHQQASQLHQGETISLDLSGMTSGLYIITLRTNNGSCSKKVSVR